MLSDQITWVLLYLSFLPVLKKLMPLIYIDGMDTFDSFDTYVYIFEQNKLYIVEYILNQIYTGIFTYSPFI